jgi:hypothetical protein
MPRSTPFRHISERMPDEPLVRLDQRLGVPLQSRRLSSDKFVPTESDVFDRVHACVA